MTPEIQHGKYLVIEDHRMKMLPEVPNVLLMGTRRLLGIVDILAVLVNDLCKKLRRLEKMITK